MAELDVPCTNHGVSVSRRWFIRSIAAGAAAALLAACGGSDSTSEATEPSSSSSTQAAGSAATQTTGSSGGSEASASPSSAATASGGSQGGAPSGTIKVALQGEPVTLDPMFAEGVIEQDICINIMDGLCTTGDNLKVVPMLALSWSQEDDLTWEFKLRQDVTFHNGEKFTAESVKATYERSLDPNVKARNTWGDDINLKEVEIIDDYTVRFHTTEFTPHMIARLANDHFMFPPKYLKDNYDKPTVLARNPVGTGAYVFKKWDAGQDIILEANPDYWGDPKPSIKTVTWSWIPEGTTRVASLQTGAVDLIQSLPPAAVPDLEKNDDVQVVSAQSGRRVYFGINTKIEPFDDVRVRQAINYGTDIESICETIFAGATTRMNNWVNPPFQNPEVHGYTYDPERAKQLLEEAGHAQGLKVTIDYDPNAGTIGMSEFPQAIATSLQAIGVEVELKAMDSNILTKAMRDRTTDSLYFRTNGAYFDPGLSFDVWRLDHSGNAAQWDDPTFQDLMKKMYTSGTPEERLQWSYEAQKIMMEQAPALFLWKSPDIYGLSKRVQGFAPNGDERIRIWPLSLTD